MTYDRYLYDRIRARDDCERMAMTLSAYNGGLGWISRDQKRASSSGLDPLIWWGSVETVNAGRSAANWRENRAYPDRIIHHHQPTYVAASWAWRMPVNLNIVGWAIALGALAAGLGYWRGEANGHERGVLKTQAAHDARQVESLARGWTRYAPTSWAARR